MEAPVGLHILRELKGKDRTYQLTSRDRLTRIVAKIRATPEARLFVGLIRSDPAIRAIFTQQWSQLSLLEEASLPTLFSLNVVSKSARGVVEREAKRATEIGGFTFERILDEAKPRLKKQAESFLGKLTASGVELENLDQETVLLHVMKSMGLLSSGSPIRALVSLMKPYEDLVADDVPDIGLTLLAMTKSRFLGYGAARREKALKAARLDEATYERAIQTLADDGFVQPVVSIVWCGEHKEPLTSGYMVGHRRLPKMNCEVCGRKLSHGTLYALSRGPMSVARQYDGFLPYVLACILEEREIAWNAEVYLEGESNDLEKDLVYQKPGGGVVIVECKTFATDTPERAVKGNLSDSMRQLSRQIESLQLRGIRVSDSVLAVNYAKDSEISEFVKNKLQESDYRQLKDTPFHLLHPSELDALPGLKK